MELPISQGRATVWLVPHCNTETHLRSCNLPFVHDKFYRDVRVDGGRISDHVRKRKYCTHRKLFQGSRTENPHPGAGVLFLDNY